MAAPYYFLPSDEVGHLATISVSSGVEDAGYPAARLCDFSSGAVEAQPAKVTGTAGDWLLDSGSATRIDLVFVWHNGDAAITLHLKRGSTTACSDLDATLALPAKRPGGYTSFGFFNLTLATGYNGDTGSRYSKLVFPANSLAPGAKLLAYSHIRAFEKPNLLQANVHRPTLRTSTDLRTDGGVPWVYDLMGRRRALTGTLRLTDADLAAFDYWVDDCAGHAGITAVILDLAVQDAFIGRLQNTPNSNPIGTGSPAPFVSDMKLQAVSTTRHLVDFGIEGLTPGPPEWT